MYVSCYNHQNCDTNENVYPFENPHTDENTYTDAYRNEHPHCDAHGSWWSGEARCDKDSDAAPVAMRRDVFPVK